MQTEKLISSESDGQFDNADEIFYTAKQWQWHKNVICESTKIIMRKSYVHN